MEVKEIPSTKNKPMFVLENYLFETEKYNGDRFYCRCIRLRHSGCPARAVIRKMPHPTISKTSGTHNHGPDEAEVIYRSTSNSMKAAVIAQPEKTLKEVYLGERATAIAELQEDHETEQIGAVVPSFDAVRCVLQRARATIRPPLPESRAEIVLEGDWALNLEGDPFLLFDDGLEDRILGFSTPELLTHMFNADTIFMDGTFRVVPTLFTQLYSLHGFFAGEMIPYVYFLLPDKTNGTYIRMFNLLKNHATSKGAVFAPARFQLDFEQATLRAIEEAFPHSEIKGCHFHFCQSLWRKVQSLGLARFYDDQAVKRFIRCSGALAMVPLHLVEDAWMEINAESPGTDHEAYGALEEYKMYFIDTWLENETVFPRALWNHYANSGPRTTNHVEGWHQSLNSTVKKRHAAEFLAALSAGSSSGTSIIGTNLDCLSNPPEELEGQPLRTVSNPFDTDEARILLTLRNQAIHSPTMRETPNGRAGFSKAMGEYQHSIHAESPESGLTAFKIIPDLGSRCLFVSQARFLSDVAWSKPKQFYRRTSYAASKGPLNQRGPLQNRESVIFWHLSFLASEFLASEFLASEFLASEATPSGPLVPSNPLWSRF